SSETSGKEPPTSTDEDIIPGILALVECSPCLETLVVQCSDFNEDSHEESVRTWTPAARDDLDLDLAHLKTVRLFDFADPNLGGEPMLTLARILLKRATSLKKMVIDALENLTNFSSDFAKMSETVVSYPKSSGKATLVVQCSDFNEDSHEETIWTLGPAVKDLDCDLLHLKRVQLLDCADPYLEGEPMLTLARILLKRAPVLETIVVDGNGYSPDESLNSFIVGPDPPKKQLSLSINDPEICSATKIRTNGQRVADEDFGECGLKNEAARTREVFAADKGRALSSDNKRAKETAVDRLSELPDSLIIHILSFLGSDVTKAAATCVLSKRWQYIWPQLPRLAFLNRTWDLEKSSNFVSWVHRTLLFRTTTHLEEFEVRFLYDECYASDVNAWIRIALRNRVKILSLQLHSETCLHILPQVLYSSSSLESLSLSRCILGPQSTIEWPSLTWLSVWKVELNEGVIQKILSCCPVLRMLGLTSCWGFRRLDVNSESIKDLTVLDYQDNSILELMNISAPFLHGLHISFCPIQTKVQLMNVSSLLSANIGFCVPNVNVSVEVMNDTMELLEKTQHASGLVLGGACIKVLSKLVARGWRPPQSSKRNWLSLETLREEISIPGILALLESYPNLETLLIESCDSYKESVRTWTPAARDDLDLDLAHLKTVRLFDFADPNLGGEPMLTLARILLKRATSLKKMVIDALENVTNFSSDFAKMSETVVSYPKSSGKAVIILRQ
ncbi:F-box family protein, partial [Striga asiatica]